MIGGGLMWALYYPIIRLAVCGVGLTTVFTLFSTVLLVLELLDVLVKPFGVTGVRTIINQLKQAVIAHVFIPATQRVNPKETKRQGIWAGGAVLNCDKQITVSYTPGKDFATRLNNTRIYDEGHALDIPIVLFDAMRSQCTKARFILGGNSLITNTVTAYTADVDIFCVQHLDPYQMQGEKRYVEQAVDYQIATIKENIDQYSEITLYGHSMGAAIMTLVYQQLQGDYPNKTIKLEIDRSFTDFSWAIHVISQHTIPVFVCRWFVRYITICSTRWDYLLGSSDYVGDNVQVIDADHSDYTAILFGTPDDEQRYAYYKHPLTGIEGEHKPANNAGSKAIHALDLLLVLALVYVFCPLPMGALVSGLSPCIAFAVPAILLAEYFVCAHWALLHQVRGGHTPISLRLAAFMQSLPTSSMMILLIAYPLIMIAPVLVPSIPLLWLRLSVFAVPVVSNICALSACFAVSANKESSSFSKEAEDGSPGCGSREFLGKKGGTAATCS